MTSLPPVGLLRPRSPRHVARQVLSVAPKYTVYAETPGHAVTTRTPRFVQWMQQSGARPV